VEKRPDFSGKGFMIKLRGEGYDIAESMNLLDELRRRTQNYPCSRVSFIDVKGKVRAALDVRKLRQPTDNRCFPLMREDFESVLYDAIRDLVSIRFGTSARQLYVKQDGVDVDFSEGMSDQFEKKRD
jgi:2-polyprenyl-6-methoxyphenol hydroxylase-like FAD-dependent oxidoreductase